MRGNNVLGLIFSDIHEERIRELTDKRTMGSVPFGGRYRLIDFPLSNMVNSGINKVGVITKSNYQSLMDHLGSGKAWDLSRKREGLSILPPFTSECTVFNSRIESLASINTFLANSREEFVLLSDSDVVCNIDFTDVVSFHMKHDADITIIYRTGKLPEKICDPTVYTIDKEDRVKDMLINPHTEGVCHYGLSMLLMKRELLMKMIADCVSRNLYNFKRDFLQRNIGTYKICAYEFKGYTQSICSMNAYFEANMALMQSAVRAELFNPDRPIFTKVRDDMPARYGLGSSVSNSLIADGCVIEGSVENCVLFRGVHVGKNTKLENCVVMQDTEIGANCHLNYVIIDKDAVIKNDRSLFGFHSYPVFISKGSVV
ncbi:glucose-1-phosphate adenylyltransferase subunit GlgD [Caproiciproducens galactitolivorans]|uniref:Glycogen biosynthesis protein GlgD n=1 Tax=Caproiciproducens galactitolivorans TaxID=642589 RepID=A0A4Z0XZ71_9FIRM|nr:glucose-1-phosphate adenylyltransferase subunit GlgD [Caproiciproducens galactitolivorans]QEY34692.1 glucose-1-phosphate adenylyltransferase subunit GlgD [Caproiciproducens galactitolivorans]TGJ75837.1 glycogen biosynthesis protein GlgD [Caproiciproducens galactitolivorans]